jgi:hypothetical protein
MKRYTVRVSNGLAGRVDNVQDQLRELGVTVTILYATAPRPRVRVVRSHGPSRSGSFTRKCRSAHAILHAVGHAWLAFCILEKAIGYWPQIKKVLVDAGLSRDQITTLGLSQAMRRRRKTAGRKLKI